MQLSVLTRGAAAFALLLIGVGCTPADDSGSATDVPTTPSHKNATYMIEGEPVTLTDGVAVGMGTTRLFGNEAYGDLNGDDREDVAFLLTQDFGASGTFYYAAVAIAGEFSYVGSNAVLIGDRIAPQTTEIRDGLIIVNFAERRPGEPMTAQPSVGRSIWLSFDPVTSVLAEEAEFEAAP